MNSKVLSTIKKFKLIDKGDTIIVGFSGGADSSALLYFLYSIKDNFNLKIHACHINHNLRGEEAYRDQKHCENICEKFNIPIHVYSVDINKLCEENGKSTELCAREQRYKIFNDLSNKFNAKIATAHTLSDKCETIIWNMCRGTALKGLIGIPAKRNYIIRPLIDCSRKDIENYCENNNIIFVTDSTNLTNDYTRNIIRNQITPVLKSLNSNYEYNISKMSNSLQNENDFIEQIALKTLTSIEIEPNVYSIDKLLNEHNAIIYRVLNLILQKNNVQVSTHVLDNIYKSLCNKEILQLNSELFLLYKNDYFTISNRNLDKTTTPFFDFTVKIGEKYFINDKIVEFELLNCEQFNNIIKNNKKALNNCLNYDKITLDMHVRQKIDGDRINLYNRNGTKTLKKLFNESKVPLTKRSELFVLCDGKDEILWLENFGCSKNVSIDNSTKNILLIKITEE